MLLLLKDAPKYHTNSHEKTLHNHTTILHTAVFSQSASKTYITHLSGEAKDTLVYEMELFDNTFINRKYSKKLTDTTSNYKKWKIEIRKGTFAKEKSFLKLTQIDGDQCMDGAMIKIVFRQIWFYAPLEKDGKLRRCNTTYHKID